MAKLAARCELQAVAVQAELASVRDELTVSQQENQHLHMQLAEKERTLQATKADLIETRLELQRTEARLTVCPLSLGPPWVARLPAAVLIGHAARTLHPQMPGFRLRSLQVPCHFLTCGTRFHVDGRRPVAQSMCPVHQLRLLSILWHRPFRRLPPPPPRLHCSSVQRCSGFW